MMFMQFNYQELIFWIIGFSADSIDIINIENPRHLSMVFEF